MGEQAGQKKERQVDLKNRQQTDYEFYEKRIAEPDKLAELMRKETGISGVERFVKSKIKTTS